MRILAVLLLTLSTTWCKPIDFNVLDSTQHHDKVQQHNHTDDGAAVHNHTDDEARMHNLTDGAGMHNYTDDRAGMHNYTDDGAGMHNYTDDGAGMHNYTDDGAGMHNHTDDGAGMHNHSDSYRAGKYFSYNNFSMGDISVSGNVTGGVISVGHSVNISLSRFLYQHGEAPAAHHNAWSYSGKTRATQWPKMFPTCNGRRQSPIDLRKYKAKLEHAIPPIKFYRYDSITAKNTEVVNNGHSLELKAIGSNLAKLSGGLFQLDYNFLLLNFHWGSEHTMEGQRFPLEMHMVHVWRGLDYLDKKPTEMHPGLGVAGFLFKISQEDNEDLKPLINVIRSVRKPESKTKLVEDLSIPDLISPAVDGSVFAYSGSLTTPTCDEVVLWSVFRTPLEISKAQLAAFEELRDSRNKPMKDNYRPVQPLNHRNVAVFMNKK